MSSINPFVDDKVFGVSIMTDISNIYREVAMDKEDTEESIDMVIESSINSLYEDAAENVKTLVQCIISPKITMHDIFDFNVARISMDFGAGMRLSHCCKFLTKFGEEHQFGRYGPAFMVKYINPIIDTRDMKIFAVEFRDMAYNEDMWKLIPNQWKLKDGNMQKLYIRDYDKTDGFRNLYERLLFLKFIVKGEL